MATRQLARESWSDYLEDVTSGLLNRPVSIEIIEPSSAPAIEAQRMALQLLNYDRRDDVFEVAAARGSSGLPSVLRHMVEHPTRIEVDSPGSMTPTMITVTAADGVLTVVRISEEGAFAG